MKKRIVFIIEMIVIMLMVFLLGACSAKNDLEPSPGKDKQEIENETPFSITMVNAQDASYVGQKTVLFTFVYTQEMFDFEISGGSISLSCLINDTERNDLGGVHDFYGIKYSHQYYRTGTEYVLALKPGENVYFYITLNTGMNKLAFDFIYHKNYTIEEDKQVVIEVEV